jgi:CHAT domain-containing protein
LSLNFSPRCLNVIDTFRIGELYASQAEFHKALTIFEKALKVARAERDRRAEAIMLVNLSDAYQALGDNSKAADYLNQALPVFRAVEDPYKEATTLFNIGQIHAANGERQKATEHYFLSLKLRQEIEDREGEAHTLSGLGMLHKERSEIPKALEFYNRSLLLMREVGQRAGEAMVLDHIAHAYDSLGEKERALEYFTLALSVARTTNDRRRIALTLSNIGLLYELQGNFRVALTHYQQSLQVDETVRADVKIDEFKTRLTEKSIPTYARAVSLSMRLGQPAEAFNLTERSRARTFLDQIGNTRLNLRQGADTSLIQQEQSLRLELTALDRSLGQERSNPRSQRNEERIQSVAAQISTKQREYEDLFIRLKLAHPEYASIVSVNPLNLPAVQKLLGKDVTLLSYSVMPDKTLAFVVTRDSIQTVELSTGEKELTASINAATSELRNPASLTDEPPPSLTQLYAWLVARVKPHLKTPIVGIVPHGVLHQLPFAALKYGRRYFGDDHKFFYLPSASALQFIQQKRKQGGERLLALAQGQAEGLPFLRYAEQEARDVAALFNTRAVVGSAATESVLRAQAGNFDILHLAAHGQLNSASPLFSRIVLARDRDADGVLDVQEVYGLNLGRVDLVVLSACETQLGAQSRGDDIVGLNRAFLYAGTPTVVASLWRVEDVATGMLMKSFYTNLKRGLSKAAALQAAQRVTRANYPHPYYWAAFVLTGDPGESRISR